MGKERRRHKELQILNKEENLGPNLSLLFLETVRGVVQVFGVGESCGHFAQGDRFPRRTYPVTAR